MAVVGVAAVVVAAWAGDGHLIIPLGPSEPPLPRLESEHPVLFKFCPPNSFINLATLLPEFVYLLLKAMILLDLRRRQAPVPLASALLSMFQFPPSLHERDSGVGVDHWLRHDRRGEARERR